MVKLSNLKTLILLKINSHSEVNPAIGFMCVAQKGSACKGACKDNSIVWPLPNGLRF